MVKIKNTTQKLFRELLFGKKVTCICAGSKFIDFISSYRDIDFNCSCVLDNDPTKTSIKIAGNSYIVKSFEEIPEDIAETIIVLTSEKFADEIVKQIDNISAFDNLDIYIPELFESDYTYYDFANNKTEIIPRKIHYCWFGDKSIPSEYFEYIESWKEYCNDYELILWNESNYDYSKCDFMKKAYENGLYAFVSDYVRLDVVYSFGGIYLDVDVEMLRPWDELLKYPLFCGFESKDYIAFGLGFGANKGNTIIREIMDEYESMSFPNSKNVNELIPCPIYQTEVLKRHGLICDGESRKYDEFLALSPVYFAPENRIIGINRPHKESFSIHHYAGSWLDDEKKINKQNKIKKYEFLMSHM